MPKTLSITVLLTLILCSAGSVWAQAPPTPRDTTIQGPQTFAMIMGISKYKYVRPLTYADKDAEMFRDYLKSPAGGSISSDNIFCLLNEEALSSVFWSKGFKWLNAKKLQKGDKLFIYLAGHGDAIDEDQFFYIAYDCNPAGDKNNYIAGGTIQLYNLKLKMAKETAKGVEVYFIMDACRTNELPGGAEGQGFLNTAVTEKRVGDIIMLATGAGQESLEDASIGSGHGLFTYYLIDGLSGMADTEKDQKITLAEIQAYIEKNVPNVAKNQFQRTQEPYICCNEFSEKTVSIVDTAYLRRWMEIKKQQVKNATGNLPSPRPRAFHTLSADTTVIETYNLFNSAVKEARLTGQSSAEYYYSLMERKYPGNAYTIDAQTTLAVEYINFAQTKVNLYLDCKDPAAIQKLRAQMDDEEKTDEINSSLNRMEKVSRQEFYEVGHMLEKAIEIIKPDDPEFAKSLEGRMYFFKARGYFGRGKRQVDISTAFNYAYNAYADDKTAAYILNTLSSLHLEMGRLDSAIHYAKLALNNAPKWRYPYVTLAYIYKTQDRPDSAIRYYRKSIDVDPENADAYVDLGHYYFSLSKNDSAVTYYERALQLDPRNPYATNNIGWVHFGRKNYELALQQFKRSIANDPRLINSYNGIGKSFAAMGQYDSARIYYEKAFSHYQDKSFVNVFIGNFFRDLDQYDSAKIYYNRAALIDPDYEEAFNLLGKVSFSMKQYDSARIYYRRALKANPYSAFALLNLGLVHKEWKNPDSTYYYFQQAVRMEPGNPSILNNIGVVYGTDKVYDSAKKYFRRALTVRPDYKPASNNMLKIYRELNQLDSITQFIKGTSQVNPNSAKFMNDMAVAFIDQKRFDSARAYLRRAIAMEPGNPQLFNNLALTMQGLRQYDSARIYLQRAVRLDPDNHLYWLNLANAFKQVRQFDSAAYYYTRQVFRRADRSATTLQAVGNFFMDMKLYDSAVAWYRRSIEADPKYVTAYSQAGLAFMYLEKPDSALVYFREIVRMDPDYPGAALNLGIVLHSKGQYDSAIVYINRAIALDNTKLSNYYQLACSYALNDQPQQAIAALEQAYAKGYKDAESLLIDPDLVGLKKLKEFEALLDKYLPDWRNR